MRVHKYRKADGGNGYAQAHLEEGQWVDGKPPGAKIPFRLPELIAAPLTVPIYFVEGEKDVCSLVKLGLFATTMSSGAKAPWDPAATQWFKDRPIIILADADVPGRAHAQKVAAALYGTAASIRIIDLHPARDDGSDVSDWLVDAGDDRDHLEVLSAVDVPEWQPPAEETAAVETDEEEWPDPKPIPRGLLEVPAFDLNFLPDALKPWVGDVSDRLQCPPDYVAVAAVVALGSVIGRRIGIKPQTKTDWMEVPNIWGGFIGRPGMLKSPAMQEALKPLHRLEAEAAKQNEVALEAYAAGMSEYKLRQSVGIALKKKELKKAAGQKIDASIDIGEEPPQPKLVRFRTNDTSYEALGELLKDNPTGILVERDELISLLRHLDHEDQVNARGFFLSGASGQMSYSFDRIGRGHIHLEAVCFSVLGGTQPARISDYVRRANAGGAGGDGLIQRFSALVWPDAPTGWRNVDTYPDSTAREKVRLVFDRAADLDMGKALRLGASKDQFDTVPYLRFDEAAHNDFLGWRTDLETRLRSGELSAAVEKGTCRSTANWCPP